MNRGVRALIVLFIALVMAVIASYCHVPRNPEDSRSRSRGGGRAGRGGCEGASRRSAGRPG